MLVGNVKEAINIGHLVLFNKTNKTRLKPTKEEI